jgi:hypothetical protein
MGGFLSVIERVCERASRFNSSFTKAGSIKAEAGRDAHR